jgi:hypothetical protein
MSLSRLLKEPQMEWLRKETIAINAFPRVQALIRFEINPQARSF